MSFPKQDSVVARLQAVNIRELTRQADAAHEDVKVLWRQSARLLKADIAAAYQASAPHGGKWDLTSFQSTGTHRSLSMRAKAVLDSFYTRSVWKVRAATVGLRAESARRQAWALAQVVPHPERIKFRRRGNAREADVPLSSGFDQRWAEWVSGYHEALMRNLRMNALNNGTVTDAIAEVDATRVNTPAYTLEAAMDRLYNYYAWEAVAGGMHQTFDENDDAEEEVWRTSGDLRVCDDCDENEGLPMDEADGTIPLHPNCNCFPQLVPASYAALLRSGDEDDMDLARQMDEEGVAPNAIVIRGEDGGIRGRAVVDFGEWEAAQGMAVQGGI